MSSGNVFDRMTDKANYSGMYANRNAEAIKASPQAETKGTGHAKNFSDAPVQKFGAQYEKPGKIVAWHALEKHAQGKTIIMQNIRTMAQLVTKVCQQC
eukprot:200839_1